MDFAVLPDTCAHAHCFHNGRKILQYPLPTTKRFNSVLKSFAILHNHNSLLSNCYKTLPFAIRNLKNRSYWMGYFVMIFYWILRFQKDDFTILMQDPIGSRVGSDCFMDWISKDHGYHPNGA